MFVHSPLHSVEREVNRYMPERPLVGVRVHRGYNQVTVPGVLFSVTNRSISFKASLLAALFCVAALSGLLGCGGYHHESLYTSLADADKAGAITHGWIPDDVLPGSSRAIHEVHELLPSTEWCAFEFFPTDSQGLRKNLRSIDALPPSVRHVPNLNVSWWPTVLEGNLDVEQIHKTGFELYTVVRPETSVTTEVLLFAINWTRGRGFFYRTRE
jgi:hypothetical protein